MPYSTPTKKQLYDRQRYAARREELLEQQRLRYQRDREPRLAYIRDYSRKRVAANLVLLQELKSKPCMDCKGSFHFVAMDFDHRPGEVKVQNVSTLARSQRTSRKNLIAEIAKCDLVCSNCHRVRTYERLGNVSD